jgi:hypothetical protein
MVFVVGTEFQLFKNFRHHTPVMPFVGIPDDCPQGCPIGRPHGFPFLDQVSQGLFADQWEDDVANTSVRLIEGRIRDLEQQVLFARYAPEIIQ